MNYILYLLLLNNIILNILVLFFLVLELFYNNIISKIISKWYNNMIYKITDQSIVEGHLILTLLGIKKSTK